MKDRQGSAAALDVSIVIPVCDEAEALRGVLEEVTAMLDEARASSEVILVDDGSTDGSAEVMDRHAEVDSRFVVIHFESNAGQTAAFLAGFRAARGRIVVTMDGDGQSPAADVPRLVAAVEAGADLAAGYRRNRHDSAWRRLQAAIANAVRNWLSGETIRDTGCSLKAFRSELLHDLPPFDGMHRFLPTLCRLNGASRVVELPVGHRPRAAGVSKYGMLDRALRAFVDLLAVCWMIRRRVRYRVVRVRGGKASSVS